jgi:hypothetical protein
MSLYQSFLGRVIRCAECFRRQFYNRLFFSHCVSHRLCVYYRLANPKHSADSGVDAKTEIPQPFTSDPKQINVYTSNSLRQRYTRNRRSIFDDRDDMRHILVQVEGCHPCPPDVVIEHLETTSFPYNMEESPACRRPPDFRRGDFRCLLLPHVTVHPHPYPHPRTPRLAALTSSSRSFTSLLNCRFMRQCVYV